MEEKKRLKTPKGIKVLLVRTFSVLLVVPLLILGGYAYADIRQNLIVQNRVSMQGNADVIASSIDSNADREESTINFFSYRDSFRKALEKAQVDPYYLTDELNDNIEPLIWYYLSSDSIIESLMVYSDRLPEDHMGDFLEKPLESPQKEWYELTENQFGDLWVMDDNGDAYVLKAILDTATSSKRIGMMVLKIDMEEFFTVANNTGYLNNGYVLTSYKNDVIAHKSIANTELDERIVDSARAGEIEDFTVTGDYYVAVAKPFEGYGTLYYYIDRRETVYDAIKVFASFLVLAVILLGAALFLGYRFANYFVGRIVAINDMADEIKNGDFDIESKDDVDDEIGHLSRSMVDMAETLRNMVKELERLSNEQLRSKENDIHYREWLFDFVVEKTNDILAVVEEGSYRPSFLTANAETVLGIPQAELLSDIRKIALAQREDETVRIDDVITRGMETGEQTVLSEIRFRNLKTNENLYYIGVLVCTIDDGGRRMALALYDRTQEIKKNHQLQEALNAAETASKAKTSFLANMSHDFRTPMNAITGFNLLIDKHAEDPEKVHEYTRKISLASQNLLSLLNDVLDMSKIESGKTTLDVKELAIGLLIEEVNSVISFQAKAKNQEYIVHFEDMEHDMFMGDRQRINEILVNILGNAVKYTPEGGRIEFTISESDSSSEGFQNVRFSVKDNGIGMKPEYKDKIFDAFTREDKDSIKGIQGTGLGMAITKSLVELMGGTIRVESEEGKGSEFIVTLRLKAVETENADFWKAHGISRALFVVSEHEEYSKVAKLFENDSVETLESPTVFGALKIIDACEDEGHPVDIIIVNETVGEQDVTDAIKTIRGKDKRHTSLIFGLVENYELREDEVKAAGANEAMQKPFFVSSLKQLIEELEEKGNSEKNEESNPLDGMKFLAAEDNDINADILTELMSMENATVTRAVNGKEAVEMFKAANEGDYDMILMDIQMPEMNGYEAAAAIRALGTEWSQNIPIIAMTANAYADDVQHAFDAGMNAHVTKPIDLKNVEKTILEFKK